MGAQKRDDRNGRDGIASLEMEPMTVESSSSLQQQQQQQSVPSRIRSLFMLVKLYMEYYPGVTSCIAALLVGLVVLLFVLSFRKPVTRNRLFHDYSKIDMNYNFKASQVDHWCLWGGDDKCACDDFTTPLSREEKKGWWQTHTGNVRRIDDDTIEYDVIFYGDEVVEGWNGELLGKPTIPPAQGLATKDYFVKTFTKDGGSEFDGLAMGTFGDVVSRILRIDICLLQLWLSFVCDLTLTVVRPLLIKSPNLLWRLRHGEMPDTLQSKVFWLMTGMNDLVRGGCSEEVTMLGILRVADEIYFSNPNSVIVIQGILPWTKNTDGSLTPPKSHTRPHLFGHHKDKGANEYSSVEAAKKYSGIWPSIQHVNAELEKFCAQHEHLVYFDASSLFLGSIGNHVYQSKEQHIITALMADGKKLTYEGYRVLGDAILKELERIIYDDDEENDVESKSGGNLR